MIAAWAATASQPPELVIAEGPARAIWQERFGQVPHPRDAHSAIDGMASLLSGTGWSSDLEHQARLVASRAGIRSIAVIDHWVNYPMRFEREGLVQLPGEIWVGDGEAARIARSHFPDTLITQHPNFYSAEQAMAAGPCPADGDALFLLEPARSDWGRAEAGEFQALNFFLDRRERIGIPPETPVRIRPHPSDPPGKYSAWLAAHPSVSLDGSPDLGSALSEARYVVGMNSAALVIALQARRTVFCALPPHAPPCVLPHPEIKHIDKL